MEVNVGDLRLVGRRVLVVVDNHFVTEDVRQAILLGGGSIVGPTATNAGALRLIQRDAPDAAVLGVVLELQSSTLVAERLADLNIPFVVVTGLAAKVIPLSLRKAPCVARPFLREELIRTLAATIAGADPTPQPKDRTLDEAPK